MRQVLLDSDIVSEILKGRNVEVARKTYAYKEAFPRLSFASVTLLEVLYGLERINAHSQIHRAELLFSENEEIIPMSADYRLAASIAGALDRRGRPIGLADPLIAACAIRRGLGIATGNTAHYAYIQEAGYPFHLENWRLG